MKLIPHPASLPAAITGVDVDADLHCGPSVLTFRTSGDIPSIPALGASERTDGLWQTTCFELFVKPRGGEGYFEFNFSPSTAWASYRFSGYRAGIADLPLAPPHIEPIEDGIRVRVDLGGLPDGDWRIALTAVIEEVDGTKSYWSLAHPDSKPDFHDPACFALDLPAPSDA